MKKVHLVIKLVSIAGCFIATASLAQSFMNYNTTPSNSTAATAAIGTPPAPGGKIAPMSPSDFKSAVGALGRQNQAKLMQQVQQFAPPAGGLANSTNNVPSSNTPSITRTSTGNVTGTTNQPVAQPARPVYNGFGTGVAPSQSGGSAAPATGGFGIKY